MKRINWLVALLSVFSLTFVACGGDEVGVKEPAQKLPQTSTLSFKAVISEITHETVSYTVTPTDAEKEYFCVVDSASVIEDFTRDKYLVSTLNQNLTDAAAAKGLTLEEYVVDACDKGVVEKTFEGLMPESDYYILVVSVDDVINEANSPEILKLKFTTTAAPVIELTFDINADVDGTNATIHVTPSDKSAIWFYTLVPSAQYAQYLDPEMYNLTPVQVIEGLYQDQLNQLMNDGKSIKEAINETFHIGPKSFNVSYLTYNTEYTNIIAGFLIDQDANISLATPVMTSTFRTDDVGEVNLTFDITVENIRAMQAGIKVVPSNSKDTFYWEVGPWDGKSTAQEVMESRMLYTAYTGLQNYPNFSCELPDTDYFVIAFGYAPGAGITTEPVMKTFRTLPAPAAEDTTFTLKASSVSAYGFTLKVTASEASTYYIVDVVSPDDYNESAIVKGIEDAFAADYALWLAEYPDITKPEFWYSYWYSGAVYRNTIQFDVTTAPGATVMGYVCAIDPNTMKVAKVHTFENLATTPLLSEHKPSIEILGYYSGREENGQVFGNAAYTAEKAIMVVKYNDLDQARSLFSYMSEGDFSNIITDEDVDIWNMIRNSGGSWSSLNDIKKPYDFYLVDWNVDYTVFAHLIDNDGLMSPIARATGKATAQNKGDIEELLTLVKDLYPTSNSKTSLQLPASMVVEK